MKKIAFLILLASCHLGFSAEVVPLELATSKSSNGWKQLAFSRGKTHVVTQKAAGLNIAVNQSAGPLVYGFSKTRKIKGIRLRGSTDGLIKLPQNAKQGAAGFDDFVFRIGVITEGSQKINPLKLSFAPTWVKEVSKLSPSRKSLGKVVFLNVNNSPTGWKQRSHPQGNNLIEERVVSTLKGPGVINFDTKFEMPLNVMGLWISCDGDDTHSKFNVSIDQIELITN